MFEEKYIKIIQDIVNKYSKEEQVMQTIEEMSELTKELIKNINRNKENETEIILEVADVEIMLAQLILIYDIDPEKIPGAIAVTAETKNREEIIKKFTNREIPVLVNCMLFTEGTDMPLVETVMIARPTSNSSLYTQIKRFMKDFDAENLNKMQASQILNRLFCR